jgi:3-oxoadipate CoA-transferase beta subunit
MSGGWSESDMARRVAQEFEDGACVNLGFGLPILVGSYISADRTVFLHSENGIIGMGPDATDATFDPDVVNASKKPVTLIPGAAIVHQADSFSLIRGGRLGYSILGALQISAHGDIANWRVPGAKGVGGVGGAMDLAVGARKVFAMMRQTDKEGRSKLLAECTFPLTGVRCVDKVFTDLGVIDCTDGGFVVRELAPGITQSDMFAAVAGPVRFELE